MMVAVSPRGDVGFMYHESSVTAPVFKKFLKRLMVGATRPIYIVVDGHSIQKTKLLRGYVDTQKAISNCSTFRRTRLI